MAWLTNAGDRTFGIKAGFGHSVTPENSGFHLRHSGLTESACNSLTRFAETIASRKTVFKETHLISASARGSKGA